MIAKFCHQRDLQREDASRLHTADKNVELEEALTDRQMRRALVDKVATAVETRLIHEFTNPAVVEVRSKRIEASRRCPPNSGIGSDQCVGGLTGHRCGIFSGHSLRWTRGCLSQWASSCTSG